MVAPLRSSKFAAIQPGKPVDLNRGTEGTVSVAVLAEKSIGTGDAAKKARVVVVGDSLFASDIMVGRYSAVDLVDENSGEIFAEAGDELTMAILEAIEKAGIKELPTLNIDHLNVGGYIRNTLAIDKNT